MRELTKSIGSFSWAMSLFGLRQMASWMRPSEAHRSLDAVTDAAERELGDVLKSTFRAGDNLQRGMVDMTFGMFRMDMLDPSRWARMASDAMDCAPCSDGGGHGPSGGSGPGPGGGTRPPSGGSGGSGGTGGGWGPMPPIPS